MTPLPGSTSPRMDSALHWLVGFVDGHATREQARVCGYHEGTMQALKRRGLVTYKPLCHPGGEPFNAWVVTDAGRVAWDANDA